MKSYLTLTAFEILFGIGLHFISMIVLYTLCYHLGWINTVPNDTSLMKWDAIWYKEIMMIGYSYTEGVQNSTAFFPLFAAVWGVLSLSALGISFFNLIIFYSAYFILAIKLQFSFSQAFFWLSIPLLFFCYVPYSESMFFMGCTLLLAGLDTNDKRLTLFGLIISASTRSVGMIFIPALVFSYLLTTQQFTVKSAIFCFRNILIVIGVTILTFIIQYLHTGEWLVFFETQKAWNRQLRLPTLPFDPSFEIENIWLDLSAIFVGLAAIFYTIKITLRLFLRAEWQMIHAQAFVFSLSYLALISLISIFYSGVWEIGSGTKLMSLPRFVFVCPFFIYVVGYQWRNWQLTKEFIVIFLLLILMCLSYATVMINHPIYTVLICIYILSYFFVHRTYVRYSLAILNLFLQIMLLDRFLSGYWIS